MPILQIEINWDIEAFNELIRELRYKIERESGNRPNQTSIARILGMQTYQTLQRYLGTSSVQPPTDLDMGVVIRLSQALNKPLSEVAAKLYPDLFKARSAVSDLDIDRLRDLYQEIGEILGDNKS